MNTQTGSDTVIELVMAGCHSNCFIDLRTNDRITLEGILLQNSVVLHTRSWACVRASTHVLGGGII